MANVKPRVPRGYRPLAAMVAVVAVVVAAGLAWHGQETAQLREQLLETPLPTPEWILATGPQPGEVLPIGDAVFPGDGPPFGPAWGNVCIQLDSALVQISPGGLFSAMRMYIDGYRVLELRPGDLFHGALPRNGTFVAYNTFGREDSVAFCLEMYLPPGTHLVMVGIPDHGLEYTWAFRTTH